MLMHPLIIVNTNTKKALKKRAKCRTTTREMKQPESRTSFTFAHERKLLGICGNQGRLPTLP
ncbi:hypothetical protein [Escherichia phage IMM-001]|nr:hypothetical protein [Escherichia phage IMM-001]